jgi:hypothetical protein
LLLGLSLLAAVQTAGCASPPSVGGASRPLQAITDFWAAETPEAVVIMVKSDRPLACTTTTQENPRGLLLRFPATVLDGLGAAYFPPPNPAVRSIRSAEISGSGREAQVFLEQVQDLPYEIHSESEGLKITFRKPFAPASVGARPAAARDQPRPAQPAPAAVVIREVRAEVQTDAVIIRVSADGPVKDVRAFTIDESPARIVFDLIRLRSAYRGEQRIAVQSPWVSQVRHAAHADKVRLVVETSKDYINDFVVETLSEGLLITVGKSVPAARQKVKGAAADPAGGVKK